MIRVHLDVYGDSVDFTDAGYWSVTSTSPAQGVTAESSTGRLVLFRDDEGRDGPLAEFAPGAWRYVEQRADTPAVKAAA